MLCNAAYCGFVSARRDKSKSIRGKHEPLIAEALFDRVQDLRRARARTLNPGRPSTRYLLRGLACCERCQARMQGTAVGRQKAPRYYCSTRRVGRGCDQPLVHADDVETQLVEFVSDFKPEGAIREEVLRRLGEDASADSADVKRRRDGPTSRH
jgi:site-specific DNA recombinase